MDLKYLSRDAEPRLKFKVLQFQSATVFAAGCVGFHVNVPMGLAEPQAPCDVKANWFFEAAQKDGFENRHIFLGLGKQNKTNLHTLNSLLGPPIILRLNS